MKKRQYWKQPGQSVLGFTAQGIALQSMTQGGRQAATLGFVTKSLRGLVPLTLILVLSAFALAQNPSSITGRITDQLGASVPGAEVRLRSRSGASSMTVTDDNGAYAFRNVAPGDYVLEINKSGFASFTSGGLHFTRGQSLTNDVKLSV